MMTLAPTLRLAQNHWVELALEAPTPEALESAVPFGFLVGPLHGPQITAESMFETIRCAVHVGPHATELPTCALVKGTNPFHEMITIGRASNNDVMLDIANVSKFHAFVRSTSNGIVLTDARSANGTWHNGRPVKPSEEARLRCGDSVELAQGNVFLYLSARSFFEAVRRQPALPLRETNRDVRREAV